MVMHESVESEMSRYIKSEVMKLTLQAGLASRGGNSVYKRGVTEKAKRALKRALMAKLKEYVIVYKTRHVNSKQHTNYIIKFASEISKAPSKTLKGGVLRIGTAQKLLNLYLKYHWVLGKMRDWETKQPPHCPFDYTIVEHLKKRDRTLPSWTKLNSIGDYRRYIRVAETYACEQSIAEWELALYNNMQKP